MMHRILDNRERARRARLRSETAVLEGSEGRKDIGLLVTAADADARATVMRKMCDVPAPVMDAASRCRQIPRHKIDHRRRAGAGGAELGVELAVVELYCDVADRHQSAKAARKTLGRKDCVPHHPAHR